MKIFLILSYYIKSLFKRKVCKLRLIQASFKISKISFKLNEKKKVLVKNMVCGGDYKKMFAGGGFDF